MLVEIKVELKTKKRPAWESAVIFLTVAVSLWMTVALYAKRDRVFKERLLIYELMTFRNQVAADLLVHRKKPETMTLPMDPCGHPYQYNPETGWVSSSTPSYRHW